MMLAEIDKEGVAILAKAGVDSPGLCSRLILCHVTGLDKLACVLAGNRSITPDEEQRFFELLLRRAKGEPLAYVLGKKAFYEHEFMVGPATLVPRPETELAVELALQKFMDAESGIFIDCGCGSGCIGLSLQAARPAWFGILLEKCPNALKIAACNARIIAPQACLLHSDLFHLPIASRSVNLVVSNPPYIDPNKKNMVMPDVLAYEPHLALFSEQSGLAHMRAVACGASRILARGGALVMEHGMDQACQARDLLQASGFANIETHLDLAGLPRYVTGQIP